MYRRCVFVLALLLVGHVGGCGKTTQETTLEENGEPANSIGSSIRPNSGANQDEPSSDRLADSGESDVRPDRESKIQDADELMEAGEWKEAEAILVGLAVVHQDDSRITFRLATVLANQGKLENAIEVLNSIPEDDPDAGLPALGQSADWCMEIGQYDMAEAKYRRIIQLIPEAVRAHRQLAYLLNRQGRRHEAAVHLRYLCSVGNTSQDELHALVCLTYAMYTPPGATVDPDCRSYEPIGNLALARWHFNEQRFSKATELLRDDVNQPDTKPALMAFFGRAAIEAQENDMFLWWLGKTDEKTKEFSDYWAAVGAYLLSERRFEEATRALCEAIKRDPTDMASVGRMKQCLDSLGQKELASQYHERWRAIRETVRVNNRIPDEPNRGVDLIADLATKLYNLDRKMEATLWKVMEGKYRGVNQQAFQQLNEQRKLLLQGDSGFPSVEHTLLGMDIKKYKLPKFDDIEFDENPWKSTNADESVKPVVASFENHSPTIGLDHGFEVASVPQASGFAVYQVFGSAVAVLDFDQDGQPDIYLGQGGAEPPEFEGKLPNALYRNIDGKLSAVSDGDSLSITTYSTGVTAGDFNQDGFDDIVVSAIGDDLLLINKGDGTFRTEYITKDDSKLRVDTSTAIADVNGDGLPDIFQIAYMEDEKMATKPKRDENGEVLKALSPLDFDPGIDRLFLNDRSGGLVDGNWDPEKSHGANGLGLVITNFDKEPGLEIFIGNDLYANQYWRRNPDSGKWTDAATTLGCGYGFTGYATASMGVAVGDFDGNAEPDIHITNYQEEAVCLYLQKSGAFQDRNIQFGLSEDSRAVLGFGSQSIDFDNDRLIDLVVTNGHVDDESGTGDSFHQPPQLFRNLNGKFKMVDVDDASSYWSNGHLGRGLATLDFNRDGKMDFLVTHLGEPTATMINHTKSENHWIQFELVGTTSERDAIGTQIQITAENQSTTEWLMAGNGYMCRNEPVLAFGLRDANVVENVTITWPSGEQQHFSNVSGNQRYLIVEGLSELIPR